MLPRWQGGHPCPTCTLTPPPAQSPLPFSDLPPGSGREPTSCSNSPGLWASWPSNFLELLPSPGSLAQGMGRGEGGHPTPDPGPPPTPVISCCQVPHSPLIHTPLPCCLYQSPSSLSWISHLFPWLQSCPSSPHLPECMRSRKLDHSTRPKIEPWLYHLPAV